VIVLLKLEKGIDRLSDWTGKAAALLALLMLVTVFVDVLLRYVFNAGSIAMQELEWHFFAAMFLFGICYAMREDAHVRVRAQRRDDGVGLGRRPARSDLDTRQRKPASVVRPAHGHDLHVRYPRIMIATINP